MAAKKAAKKAVKKPRSIRSIEDAEEMMEEIMDSPAAGGLADVDEDIIVNVSEAMREVREPRVLTIDDIAARHTCPEGAPPAYGHREVPSEERPDRRDGPSMGQVKMIFDDPEVPDQSDERIRSLEDLMARFPFMGPLGDYFIRVDRKAPKTYLGMQCTGVLRKIVDVLSYEQFVEMYGGGEYELTVYGPPRTGGFLDPATGKVRKKALTQPIRFTVPYDKEGVFGMAPNPSASIPEVDEMYPMETPMQRMQPPTGVASTNNNLHPFNRPMRVTTPADAKIHDSDLQHEREREDRMQAREDAERENRSTIELEKLRMRERAEERALAAERARADAAEERRREVEQQMREKVQGQTVDPADLIRAVAEFKGDGSEVKLEMQRQAESHKNEITRLMEDQRREVSRMEEGHKRELERERTLAEEKVRMAREETSRERERAERMGRDAEDRAEKKSRDAEERAERRIEDIRRDFDRQLAHSNQMWESRLKDEQRNNERDLASRKDSHESSLRTEKVTFEVQLRASEQEMQRLRAENDRLRADLESKGDVVAQVQRVTEVAEALGFKKDEGGESEDGEEKGPTDWKSLAAGIGMNLVQQLPDLVRSAGDAVGSLRANKASPAAQSAPEQNPMEIPSVQVAPSGGGRHGFQPRQRLTFANEGSPDVSIDPSAPMLAPAPIFQPQVQQYNHPPSPQPQPVVHQPAVVVPPQYPVAAPSAPPPAPPPQPQQARQAAPTQPTSVAIDPAVTAQVLMYRSALEESVDNDEDAKEVVEGLVKSVGPELVRQFAQTLSAEKIIAVVEAQPDGGKSNLLKPHGRKWLRAFEAAARAV